MPLIITTRQLTQRSHFYRQFAQLTAAGLGPAKTLEMLERNPPARSFRAPIREMIGHLEQGDSVSDALKRLGRWMPSFDVALIEAGEHSGRLDAVMRLLADYYEERAQMVRQMMTDLAYPLFVFHFMIFLLPAVTLFQSGSFPRYFLSTFGVLIPIYLVVFAVTFASQGKRGRCGGRHSSGFCGRSRCWERRGITWRCRGWPRRWRRCLMPA